MVKFVLKYVDTLDPKHILIFENLLVTDCLCEDYQLEI